jgi:hypothetical protein
VSGWEPRSPDGTGSASYWAQRESDPFSPGQLLRNGWRLYRSTPRPLVLIAAMIGAIQAILAIPSFATAVALVDGMFDVMASFLERVMADPQAYRAADQRALQAELEAQLQAVLVPANDFAVLGSLGAGVGVAVGLVGTAVLAAMALSIAAGRPVPVPFAFRLVAARGGLLKPIVVIGIGWIVVSLLSLGLQGSPEVLAWAGTPGSPRSALIGSLLSVMAVVVLAGIVVVAVRWALFVPAVLVEALGVGPGLSRAAQLSKGIRIRLGVAIAGALFLEALVTGIIATVAGFAVGLSARSVPIGFTTYLLVNLVGNALWAPWLPATLAVAYRQRTLPADSPTTADAGST